MCVGSAVTLLACPFRLAFTPDEDLGSRGAGLGWGAGLVAVGYQAQAGGRAAAPLVSWVPLGAQPDVASLNGHAVFQTLA